MNYPNANEMAIKHKQELAEFQVQATCCPTCGTFFLLKAAMTRAADGVYEGTPVKWAKPPFLYVLSNIFHYFVRKKFAGMYAIKYDDITVRKVVI